MKTQALILRLRPFGYLIHVIKLNLKNWSQILCFCVELILIILCFSIHASLQCWGEILKKITKWTRKGVMYILQTFWLYFVSSGMLGLRVVSGSRYIHYNFLGQKSSHKVVLAQESKYLCWWMMSYHINVTFVGLYQIYLYASIYGRIQILYIYIYTHTHTHTHHTSFLGINILWSTLTRKIRICNHRISLTHHSLISQLFNNVSVIWVSIWFR